MDKEKIIRIKLLEYLDGDYTHKSWEEAVKDFPMRLINKRVRGIPYSAYQLLEHIRITQADMIEFMKNPDYIELDWPSDYWVDDSYKASPEDWQKTLAGYRADLEDLRQMLKFHELDMFVPFEHGDGQTFFQEILKIIDHTSHHTGELIMLRRLLGVWPG